MRSERIRLFAGLLLLMGTTALAGDRSVSLHHLGLRLGAGAIEPLSKYAVKLARTYKLHESSIELDSLVAKGEDVESLFVTFRIRDTKVKDTNSDGAFLFCQGRLLPEEQESDPSDILWKLKDARCEK